MSNAALFFCITASNENALPNENMIESQHTESGFFTCFFLLLFIPSYPRLSLLNFSSFLFHTPMYNRGCTIAI
jgi:hypothetical protein